MLSKATKFSRFCEIQNRFSHHIAGSDILSAGIWRKLFWHLALTEVKKEDLFGRLKEIMPLPKRKVGKIKSVYEVIPSALRVKERSNLYDLSDYCARSDYLPDSFIAGFGGKYWKVDSWESNGMYSCDYDFTEYFIEDFFSKYEDRCVTEENLPEFWDVIRWLLSEFIPVDSIEPVVEHLEAYVKKKPGLFYSCEESDKKTKVFRDDFGVELLEEVASFLRFNSSAGAKKAVIDGMRALYPLQDICDEEIYGVYKALYDQPLMVQFNDCSCAGITEYVLLVSRSLGYLYNHKDDYSSLGLCPETVKELSEFYEKLREIGEVFPYCKEPSADIDTYCSEDVYVAGCYPLIWGSYNINESVDMTIPSLPDILLLQWADELYEKILSEKKGECA